MKNAISSIMCLFLFFPFFSAFAAKNLEKIEIEKNFEIKLRHFFPDNKFSLSVTVKVIKPQEMTLFGDVKVDEDEEVLKNISGVKVVTDADVTSETIGQILGVNGKLVRLEKFDLKRPEVKVGEWDEVLAFASKYQMTLVFFGIMSIIICLMIATVIIKNSISDIPAPIARAFGEASSPREAQVEKKFEQKEVQNFKKDPKPIQLKAILSDLYWTSMDAEASYFIRQHQEIEVYQELSFGIDYINYLKMIAPQPFNIWDDPYYLSPNEAFLEMSISDMKAEYFLNCSSIRLKLCSHSSYELAKLRLSANKRQSVIEAKKSAKRELEPSFVFKFSTIEEEEEFLSSDLPEYVKHQSPSLYLFSELSDEAFNEIAKDFSVKELAECWIGPKAILSIIRQRLPERKGMLLDEILKSTTSPANRSNEKFQLIIKRARRYAESAPANDTSKTNAIKLVV